MSEARRMRRHPLSPGQEKKRVNLFKKAFNIIADKNLDRYHLKAQEIIELYHQLCLQWEDKGIPNYKKEIAYSCNERWLKYCSHNRFCHPKPKRDYFQELINHVI